MSMPKGNIRLNKITDVRRLLSRVINELMQKEPSSIDRARVIATLSNSLMKSIELGDMEARLDELERRINEAE